MPASGNLPNSLRLHSIKPAFVKLDTEFVQRCPFCVVFGLILELPERRTESILKLISRQSVLTDGLVMSRFNE